MTSKTRTTCPRCHGPATIIDKAPPGESGDVIRCDAEATCVALSEAANEMYAAVVDAAHEFVRRFGPAKMKDDGREIKVPGYAYRELAGAVQDWKDAGEALVKATRAHAAAVPRAA